MRNNIIAIAVLFSAVSALSCKSVDRHSYLNSEEVSIARLKELYKGNPVEINENYTITGTVVSDDQYGNFYKTIIVEDSTAGIEIKIDMERIFSVYRTGGKVKILCRSLVLGSYGGLVQLGSAPSGGYETGYISRDEVSKHISDTGLPAESYRPLPLSLKELARWDAPAVLCRKVSFEGVRFVEAGDGAAWCESGEDTDRTLTDDSGNTITVRTSAYARFASFALPEGEVYIEGILSWFNGSYQLRVLNETAVFPL